MSKYFSPQLNEIISTGVLLLRWTVYEARQIASKQNMQFENF